MKAPYLLWIGAGSNQGDRLLLLEESIARLNACGITVLRTSSIYETAPVGFVAETLFLNAVFECRTSKEPAEVLQELMQIERDLGRQRRDISGYESRPIDLDILLCENQEVINNSELTIPHPRLQDRMFVLAPLNELIPAVVHPLFKRTILTIYQQCIDKNEATVYHKPLFVRQ